jgi:hypothetical protein
VIVASCIPQLDQRHGGIRNRISIRISVSRPQCWAGFAEVDARGKLPEKEERYSMFEMRIIIQLLVLLLFSTTVYAQINPSNRVTAWQPGVTHDAISN